MTSESYNIFFSWTPREESPERILERMKQSVQALSKYIPIFESYIIYDALEALRHFSRGARKRAESPSHVTPPREPHAPSGFMVFAAPDYSPPEGLHLCAANAGRKTLPGMCGVTFFSDNPATPAIASLGTFKSIILTLTPIWEATYAQAYTRSLQRLSSKPGSIFWPTWTTWLAPSLANDFEPSEEFTTERLPDCGVFLIATTDTFDIENPAHVTAAKAIQSALMPVGRKLVMGKLF